MTEMTEILLSEGALLVIIGVSILAGVLIGAVVTISILIRRTR